jgi:hypothetical protein
MVPLAMAAVLALTPASQARGRKSSCCSDSYCVVGYKTELRDVCSYEWVTVKEKAKVTEYQHVKEKAKVTKYEAKNYTETKPYTYWVCEAVTVEEDVTRLVCDRVETKKTGTRKVAQHVIEEVPYKHTVDQGCWETQCYEQVCHSRKRRCCDDSCCYTKTCYKKVWVPKLVVVEGKAKVSKCIYVEQPYDYVEVSYKHREVKEKAKVTKYVKVEKKGAHTYHFCKYVPVVVEVDVTVCRPIVVEKDVEYKKRVQVNKKVEVQVPIYGCSSTSSCGSGCGK